MESDVLLQYTHACHGCLCHGCLCWRDTLALCCRTGPGCVVLTSCSAWSWHLFAVSSPDFLFSLSNPVLLFLLHDELMVWFTIRRSIKNQQTCFVSYHINGSEREVPLIGHVALFSWVTVLVLFLHTRADALSLSLVSNMFPPSVPSPPPPIWESAESPQEHLSVTISPLSVLQTTLSK